MTYLFGLAAVNGTIEWLIDRAVQGLRRPACAEYRGSSSRSQRCRPPRARWGPAGVAMLAPLCLRLGERYGVDRRMTALMVMHGSCLGFTPLNGLAVIVRQALDANGLRSRRERSVFGNAAYNLRSPSSSI